MKTKLAIVRLLDNSEGSGTLGHCSDMSSSDPARNPECAPGEQLLELRGREGFHSMAECIVTDTCASVFRNPNDGLNPLVPKRYYERVHWFRDVKRMVKFIEYLEIAETLSDWMISVDDLHRIASLVGAVRAPTPSPLPA